MKGDPGVVEGGVIGAIEDGAGAIVVLEVGLPVVDVVWVGRFVHPIFIIIIAIGFLPEHRGEESTQRPFWLLLFLDYGCSRCFWVMKVDNSLQVLEPVVLLEFKELGPCALRLLGI